MKKIFLTLFLSILFLLNFCMAQKISKSIEMMPNELSSVPSARYNNLTFNEYWMINHLGREKILINDFYNQKSFKEGYKMKNDSLSLKLYSIALKNELDLRSTLIEIYKDKAEYTINDLFLDMLLSHSEESIKRFKEKRNKIIEEIKDNEKDYPDSIYNLIQYQDLKYKLNASGSIELKRFSDQKFYNSHRLIKRNYGLSISSSGPIYFGALLMSASFDFNFIQIYNQKYTVRELYINGEYVSIKTYLDEYSDTSKFKVTPSLSYSLGILFINNQSLNASLSCFLSSFTIKDNYGYLCSGISLVSNIYLSKYYQKHNINGNVNFKKALKISINYDIINKQASIGIGVSLNKITQFNFLNTNML